MVRESVRGTNVGYLPIRSSSQLINYFSLTALDYPGGKYELGARGKYQVGTRGKYKIDTGGKYALYEV